VSHWVYLAILAGCLIAPIGLELLLHVGVLAQWRRLLLTLVPVWIVFVTWDAVAVADRQWSYAAKWITGVRVFDGLPIEELAFFAVVPACAIATLEAVRRRRPSWTIGDEPSAPPT
jgi:lycopene cyclase domain-containing protein